MKARWSQIAAAALGLALGVSTLACAQGPGGPPHSGSPPGAPPGAPPPGAPSGPNNAASPNAGSHASSATAHAGQQLGPVGRWWDDKSVAKSVGLSKDQQKKMDAIIDAHKPAIVDSYKQFLTQQAELDKVNKDPKSDQAAIFAAIDSVNQARTSLQKATAQMQLEIRQQMTPDQIVKLEKIK